MNQRFIYSSISQAIARHSSNHPGAPTHQPTAFAPLAEYRQEI
ncbi:hypothetical protein [Nostoc sp. FACHB-190]|nr:hypothetical protein [Nostoc sp. FACHB-190]